MTRASNRTPAGSYHECGTYGGYQKHRRLGEHACAECVKAQNEYRKGWRADRETKGDRERLRNNARGRALSRLGRLHQDEFRALYAEELRKEGLKP